MIAIALGVKEQMMESAFRGHLSLSLPALQ